MTFDPVSGELVQFGGAGYVLGPNSSIEWQSGTWILNATGWANLSGVTPPLRWQEDLAYDPSLGGVLMFGGNSGVGPALNDSWLFSNGSWTNISREFPGPLPGTVTPDAMVDDLSDGYLLLVTENAAGETWVLGNPPPFARAVLPVGPVEAGEPYTLGVATASNAPPLTVTALTKPPGCTAEPSEAWNCTSPSAGTFPLNLSVTDVENRSTTVYSNITILPSLGILSFSASPSTIHVGDTVAFQLRVVGGLAPFTVNYSGLPSGCLGGDVVTFDCSLEVAGVSVVRANVADSGGLSRSANVTVGVWPLPRIAAFSVSPNVLEVGDTLSLRASIIGGAPPVSIRYVGAPPGCALVAGPDESCNPSISGAYNVGVNVTDSLGASSTAFPETVGVRPALNVSGLNVLPSGISVGQTFQAQVEFSGGIPPFAFQWSGLPTGCNTTTALVVCTANASGSFEFRVIVSDADGHQSARSDSVLVTGGSPPGASDEYLVEAAAAGLVGAGAVLIYSRYRRRRSAP